MSRTGWPSVILIATYGLALFAAKGTKNDGECCRNGRECARRKGKAGILWAAMVRGARGNAYLCSAAAKACRLLRRRLAARCGSISRKQSQRFLRLLIYDNTIYDNTTMSTMTDTPNTDSLSETLRTIKRSLRGVMNGPVSQSMREKGLTYKVNFGVELPRLRQMAEAWPHTYDLAAALWKEDIRECRLLAAMLMPAEAFDADLAALWVEQMRFVEEAECTVFHLFSHLPYASARAFAWIARDEQMFRLVGWLLLGRLFANGATPSDRDADEMIDQAMAELPRSGTPVARAAYKALMHYAGTGDEAARRVDSALDRL